MKLFTKFLNCFVRESGSKLSTKRNAMIGQEVVVLEDINPERGTGRVQVGDGWWMATTSKEQIIPKNARVTIVKVHGLQLVVQ